MTCVVAYLDERGILNFAESHGSILDPKLPPHSTSIGSFVGTPVEVSHWRLGFIAGRRSALG